MLTRALSAHSFSMSQCGDGEGDSSTLFLIIFLGIRSANIPIFLRIKADILALKITRAHTHLTLFCKTLKVS